MLDVLSTRAAAALVVACLIAVPALAGSRDAPLPFFEIRPAPGQTIMVPLGEGEITDATLRVTLDGGVLQRVRYHAACGDVVMHGPKAIRIPAFAPLPSSQDPTGAMSRVCGDSGAGRNVVVVERDPGGLGADALESIGVHIPVLPGGERPEIVGADPEPGCFAWLELSVDATGLRPGDAINAVVETYRPGRAPTGRPDADRTLYAAAVTR